MIKPRPRWSTVLLVRHGQAGSHPDHAGRWDPPLSEIGRAQAGALAERLAELRFDSARVSPLRRAGETGQLIHSALVHQPSLTVDDRLAECHRGRLEGVSERTPEFRAAWRGGTWAAWPGGEDRAQFRSRVGAALDRLHDSPGNHLVVTHGNVINELLCLVIGVTRVAPFRPATASATLLRTDSEGTVQVLAVNDLWHLEDSFAHHLAG
ncbi:hypothetical protein COO58_24735 [Micromonospora sp. WMMA1996]|uniref:histidine phosphatase family protein n=1 Tax=Micromonospora sp. WMMA1996 TaxID=2039878 RepID=UPI000BF26E96|nr:histidine phosphatase family protein [Micromonospora sp. WMMA1996]PGH41743.1 hypothetical protein COO58_24735 [Micromonospora sp. WMMA1996]